MLARCSLVSSTFLRSAVPRGIRSFSVIHLSDEAAVEKFHTVNNKSVLYFTANWCGPCRMIKPIYEELAGEYKHVAFGQIDVDENDAAAVEFEIAAVPTFVLFDGQKAIHRFSGADANKLKQMVADLAAR